MSCTGNVIPNCLCGPPVFDREGRVVRVRTCPACQQVRLDVIRGVEYAIAHVSSGDTVKHVLLKQTEFFSQQSMQSPGGTSYGEQRARSAAGPEA